jgi:hypothetical protein
MEDVKVDAKLEAVQRSVEEKLKDAHRALRNARQELGRAVQQRDQANGYVSTLCVKVDQLLAWIANLQAEFDAQPAMDNTVTVAEVSAHGSSYAAHDDHDSSTGE